MRINLMGGSRGKALPRNRAFDIHLCDRHTVVDLVETQRKLGKGCYVCSATAPAPALMRDLLDGFEPPPGAEDDDLFNEERLYEALGKDDARTVLALYKRFQEIRLACRGSLGDDEIVKHGDRTHEAWRARDCSDCMVELVNTFRRR
jgi:hypothetical protein